MIRRRTLIAALTLAAALLLTAGSTPARAAEAETSVESARAALGSHWTYPWYDSQTDSIRRLDVPPEKEEPAEKKASSRGSRVELNSTLLMIGVGIVAGILVYFLARAYLQAEDAPAVDAKHRTSVEADVQKIEALPFRLDPTSDLLAEARRQYEQGHLDLAMIYLYSHQLLELDRHHLIHLAKGKTNRQYLREIPAQSRLRELMTASMVTFEDVFFGHHPLSRPRFESCWAGLDEFSRLVQGGPA